ncbi:hypothetical protein [Nocardiopsis alba]|uniref:hypothetical protein n=1 Tax=Nocardiopsis alba TaxID=53437 RepID=UPI003636D89F
MLDQQMPLSDYSPEDRLNALILALRARSRADPATLWAQARLLGTPPDAMEALMNGDMRNLHAALAASAPPGATDAGWSMLASLLAYGDGFNADLDELATAQAEYEEIALGEKRPRLSTTASSLNDRGYRFGVRRPQTPVAEVTDPGRVNTYPELVQALLFLRTCRGTPSYREMAALSVRHLSEWDAFGAHQSRSHTGMQRVTKSKKPRAPAVLAFVRGCGVTSPQAGRAWADACARAAVHDELERMPRRPPRLEDTWQAWIERPSTTGPNPSMA